MPQEIFDQWHPDSNIYGDFSHLKLFLAFEKKLDGIIKDFFREHIFSRYGIAKPEGYNETIKEALKNFLEKYGLAMVE